MAVSDNGLYHGIPWYTPKWHFFEDNDDNPMDLGLHMMCWYQQSSIIFCTYQYTYDSPLVHINHIIFSDKPI